jgi:hypothetical protein
VSPRELVFNRAFALLAATKRRIDHHIAAYSDRDDMAGTRLLLESLHRIAEDAQREVIAIQRELAEWGEEQSSKRVERKLRDVRMIARNTAWLTGQPLNYVTEPHGREFDPIAAAYSRMARAIESRTELVFRRSEHRGYALSPPLLAILEGNLVNRGSEFVEQIERLPTILYVQYPALAEGDVLQHLLIAHEVAHLVMRLPIRKRTTAEDRFESAILALKETDNEAYLAMQDRSADGEGARNRPRSRALRWFTEIACDILAVRLAGPAYYLALCEHALVRQWFYLPSDGEGETHPHLAWRLNRAHTQLEPFHEALKPAERKRVAAVFGPYAAAVPDPAAKIAEERYGRAIELALDTLVEDLDQGKLIGDAGLSPAQLAEELPLVLRQLEDELAPAERIQWSASDVRVWKEAQGRPPRWSEPLDWRSILNGGFLHLLETSKPPAKPLRGAWQKADEHRQRAVDHLRGSVELSEFQRAAADVAKLHILEAQPVA